MISDGAAEAIKEDDAMSVFFIDAKHQDKGYTANLVFRLHRSDGSAVEKLHTAWTHKGRKFLYHELKRRGILPMAEQEG